MDYNSEILKAIEASNAAFEAFKIKNDARLDAFEIKEAKGNRVNFKTDDTSGSGGPYDNRTLVGEHKDYDQFLRRGEQKSLSVGGSAGADGGFAVPKAIDGLIETLLLKASPIRQIASVVQISTQDYHKLVNVRGEAAAWVAETDARTGTNTPKLADIKPTMGELYANAQSTQQMLDDVFFNAEAWLTEVISDQFVAAESEAFVTGDGTNKPTGFLAGTITGEADGVRAFGSLQYIASGASGAFKSTDPTDCLVKAVQSMHPGYRAPGEAAWLMNPNTLAALMQLKDSLGRPLIWPAYASGERNMLLGYPVYEAQHMPDISAGSHAIAFGNWKRGYTIVDRIGTRVLRDPFSNKPYVGFYVTRRTGAAVINSSAIKTVKFAAT